MEISARPLRQYPLDPNYAHDNYEVLIDGSHCLIFHIPDPKDKYPSNRFDPTFLRNFFNHQSVTVVGRGMKAVAEKLDRDFGIKIMRWLDLNELAVRAMRREDLDLARYDLDRLARTVLGKRFDVVRDDEPVDWYRDSRHDFYYDLPLSVDKVMFATVNTYLCFMIGTKLQELIRSLEIIRTSGNNAFIGEKILIKCRFHDEKLSRETETGCDFSIFVANGTIRK